MAQMKNTVTGERALWRRCFWAGLATIALAVLTLVFFPTIVNAFAPGYGTPVIAFEFAQTPSDIHTLFGYPESTNWQYWVGQMKTGTYADFPFILAFGTFMVSFFHAAYRQTAMPIYKFIAAVALIAALSDIAEDVFALKILSNIETSSGVEWMHYFAKAKFLGLGLVGLGAGLFLLRQPRTLRKIEGVLAGLGGALVIFALTKPSQMGDYLGLGTTIMWLAMLAYAATQTFKKA